MKSGFLNRSKKDSAQEKTREDSHRRTFQSNFKKHLADKRRKVPKNSLSEIFHPRKLFSDIRAVFGMAKRAVVHQLRSELKLIKESCTFSNFYAISCKILFGLCFDILPLLALCFGWIYVMGQYTILTKINPEKSSLSPEEWSIIKLTFGGILIIIFCFKLFKKIWFQRKSMRKSPATTTAENKNWSKRGCARHIDEAVKNAFNTNKSVSFNSNLSKCTVLKKSNNENSQSTLKTMNNTKKNENSKSTLKTMDIKHDSKELMESKKHKSIAENLFLSKSFDKAGKEYNAALRALRNLDNDGKSNSGHVLGMKGDIDPIYVATLEINIATCKLKELTMPSKKIGHGKLMKATRKESKAKVALQFCDAAISVLNADIERKQLTVVDDKASHIPLATTFRKLLVKAYYKRAFSLRYLSQNSKALKASYKAIEAIGDSKEMESLGVVVKKQHAQLKHKLRQERIQKAEIEKREKKENALERLHSNRDDIEEFDKEIINTQRKSYRSQSMRDACDWDGFDADKEIDCIEKREDCLNGLSDRDSKKRRLVNVLQDDTLSRDERIYKAHHVLGIDSEKYKNFDQENESTQMKHILCAKLSDPNIQITEKIKLVNTFKQSLN